MNIRNQAALFFVFLFPAWLLSQSMWNTFDAQDYRIDSSSTQFSSPPFSFFHTDAYEYDDQNRLVRKRRGNMIEEITYGDLSETRKILVNFNADREIRKTFDHRGNMLTETEGSINSVEIFTPYEIDSFWYNQNNQVISHNKYRIYDYGPVPPEQHRYYYNDKNLLDSMVTKRVNDKGELLTKISVKYEYNDNLQLVKESEMIHWYKNTYNIRSDYSYKDQQLTKKEVTRIAESMEITTQIYHYIYSSNTTTEIFEDLDPLYGLDTSRITRYVHSSSPYLAYDTISLQVNPPNSIPHTETRWHTIDENERGDTLVHVETTKIKIVDDPTLRGGRIITFYSRKIPRAVRPSSGRIKVMPNPVQAGSNFLVLATEVEFDMVRIYSESGQLVRSQRIAQPINVYLQAPDFPGLYFVQAYNGNVPVSNISKLVVASN